MNKSQLVDALADRLGDRRTAATAVDALLEIVVDTVRAGDSVSIAGFGVFESRARAARTGRNPRTGETVEVPATTVPAFRAGTGFRSAVAGEDTPAAAPAPARRRRPAAAAAGDGTGAATNGAGAPEAAAALNGAVELSAPDAAAVVATAPAAAPAKSAKKPRSGKAGKVEKAEKAGDAKDGKGKKKGKSKK